MNRSASLSAFAAVGLVTLASVALIWQTMPSQAPKAPAVAEPTASPGSPEAPSRQDPSFDVVRLDPQGNLVMAGRAEPGAAVAILDGGKVIGKVTADDRGEWVFAPDARLAPGQHDLQLQSTAADGRVAAAQAPVTMVVPGKAGGTPLAIKHMADGTSIVMLGPQAGSGAGPLSVEAVDYAEDRLSASGKAPPGASLRVYLDGRSIGDVRANTQGRWSMPPRDLRLTAGRHVLRLDQVGGDGKVTARIEVAFAQGSQLTATGSVTVEEGNTLWRIARSHYGQGAAYTLIYQANKNHIRDPNLIYPGQVFSLPEQ